jgi:iron complex outermembrane receptor protein
MRQDFLWGVGLRLSSGDAGEIVPTLLFTPSQFTDKLYSGFAQDEITIVPDRFALTVGSKLLHNTYTGFEFEPGARVLWTPNARQSVWAAVTRAVRTPSRIEEDIQLTGILAPNPLTYIRIVGDRQFKSEDLMGYELGYRSLVKPKVYVDIAAFYNNYNHLLSAEPGAPFSENTPPPVHTVVPYFFRNGLLGRTSGFEIAPDWTPTGWWRLRGSYSYLYMKLKPRTGNLDATSANYANDSSPHHQIVIQSTFDLPKRLEFDQTIRYVSSLPAQRVGAYETADVRFSWRAFQSAELSVVGQNLFQPHHAEFGGDPGSLIGMKRSVYGQITWRTGER